VAIYQIFPAPKVGLMANLVCVKRAARVLASNRVQVPKVQVPFIPFCKLWALELGPGVLCAPRTVGSKFRYLSWPNGKSVKMVKMLEIKEKVGKV
jgi:hypothetical protein